MKVKLKLCDGCGEHKRIFKNVTEDGVRKRLCAWCSKSYDASQKKEYKPTKFKPIAPRSPKRQKQERLYSKKRKVFLEENPLCQIPVPGICTHKATDVHHVDGRVEDDLTDEEGFRSGCRACHKWTHDHPEEARILGYLI